LSRGRVHLRNTNQQRTLIASGRAQEGDQDQQNIDEYIKTIVLISEFIFASRTASNAEMPARILAPKKMLPQADPTQSGSETSKPSGFAL
jgi:hypothetical protein